MDRDALKAAILALSSPPPVKCAIDSLGDVYVRKMTAYDSSELRKKLEKHDAADSCETGRYLASILCDESGSPLFDVEDKDTVLKLAKLEPNISAAVLKASNAANSFGTDSGKA